MTSSESSDISESTNSDKQSSEKSGTGKSDTGPAKQETLSVAYSSIYNAMVAAGDAELDAPIVEKACSLCDRMIDDLKGPLKKLHAEDPEFLDFKEGVKEVKSALSNKKSKRSHELKEYFAEHGVDEGELEIIRDFGTALVTTVEFLSAVDPMRQRDGNNDSRYKEACSELGSRTNSAFGKFFMNMQQRYGLKEKEMFALVNSVFTRQDLYEAFRGRDLGEFQVGIYTFVKAYSILNDSAEGPGRWQLPSPEEDTKEAIDLIRVPEDKNKPTILYTIKTGEHGSRFHQFDLDTYMDEGQDVYIDNAFSSIKGGTIKSAVGILHNSVRERRSRGENVKGFLVLA